MLIGFVGPRGHGKTLLMSARLHRRWKRGYNILTNYSVNFDHGKVDAEELVKMGTNLKYCCIGIDEIHILLDSRNSMSNRNKMITYFILQTRKRHVVLMFTTQDEGQVDVRLRRNVDVWVYCKKVIVVNGKVLRVAKRGEKSDWFTYEFFDGLTGELQDTRLVNGRKWYGLFDTEEVITDW